MDELVRLCITNTNHTIQKCFLYFTFLSPFLIKENENFDKIKLLNEKELNNHH